MKTKIYLLFLVIFACLSIFSQNTLCQNNQTDEDDVVKITTNLVQLDAVAVDKNGNPVTDLNSEDFEVFQDGKAQRISSFTFVDTGKTNQISKQPEKFDKKKPLPPSRNRPNPNGRLITFIIDDGNCGATVIGLQNARKALEKFVTEQMQSNDLVAIYQTRNGSSLLQQYSSDKTKLLATAKKIRWYPQGRCGSPTGEIFTAARENNRGVKTSRSQGSAQAEFESPENKKARQAAEDKNSDNLVVGTLGVIRYIINGLEKVGGRKMVFFMSDGFRLNSRDGQRLRTADILRDLTDTANRASVIINTIDVRGVVDTRQINAEDDIPIGGSDTVISSREEAFRDSQDGLSFIADETGGRFYQGNNRPETFIERGLNAEKGYYLIGYEPDDETFKGKKFHSIEIKLKRPGLKIYSRSGFIGTPETVSQTKKRTSDSELYDALIAPLPEAGLNLRLTAFFENTAAKGNFVRSLIQISGNDVTFVNDSQGFKKAVFDVVAVTLNEKNEVVDEFNRTHTLKIEEKAITYIQENGLLYTTDVPIKKPGIYNFRVAMRDSSSKVIGSASQIIEIPDLRKEKIYLSGLSVSAVDKEGKFIRPSFVKPEKALAVTNSTAIPAIRTFNRGAVLAYSYSVYNAELDNSGNNPKISIEVNLYKDGELVFDGQPQASQFEKQDDWSRISDYGYLKLKTEMGGGDYALQVIVKDLLNGKVSSQFIDFEIIE